MGFKKNEIKVDLRSYPNYIIMGAQKIGKSTLFRDIVLEEWGDKERGLLINFGKEEGYKSISDLQFECCNDWDKDEDENGERGFVQIVDDIIENNKDHQIKAVCLDTLDEMFTVATKEVLRMHKREKGTIVKSLNGALGGYGEGYTRLSEIISEQYKRLRDANIAVFVLAHTKLKEFTDTSTGQSFEYITNSLQSNVFKVFADSAQMIVIINNDLTIEDGKITSQERNMYFREVGLIKAGSRFPVVPEKLSLSAKNFLKAFETGVKSSFKSGITDEEFNKLKAKEGKSLDNTVLVEKPKVEEVSLDELKAEIKELIGTKDAETKKALQKKLTDAGIPTKYVDIEDAETLKRYIAILK